jgi:hypothetical protein
MVKTFELLSDAKLNELRGKAMAGHITTHEMMMAFNHLTLIEDKLNELDCEDYFGSEGWRHFFGIPE